MLDLSTSLAGNMLAVSSEVNNPISALMVLLGSDGAWLEVSRSF